MKLYKTILALMFLFYLFVLIKVTLLRSTVTLFGIPFLEQDGSATSFETAMAKANFIPFYSIYYYVISIQEPLLVGIINVFGNVILFVPFGLFLPLLWPRLRKAKSALAVIFLTSISFEIIQLFLGIGNFDIDDTLLNTLGGLIGYLLYSSIFKSISFREN